MRMIFFFVSYLFSLYAVASTLTVPAPFEVLKVDGKDYNADFFTSTQRISLSSGKHVIVLRYKELFEDFDHDDHTTIKSAPFALVFTMSSEALYLFSPPNKDEAAAKAFAHNPMVSLVDANKVSIESRVMLLNQFEHQQLLSASEISLNEIDVNTNSHQKVITPAEDQTPPQEPLNEHSRALDMLMYWWQQASAQEQQAFIEHMENIKE